MAFNADELNFEFILAIQGYNIMPIRDSARDRKSKPHILTKSILNSMALGVAKREIDRKIKKANNKTLKCSLVKMQC